MPSLSERVNRYTNEMVEKIEPGLPMRFGLMGMATASVVSFIVDLSFVGLGLVLSLSGNKTVLDFTAEEIRGAALGGCNVFKRFYQAVDPKLKNNLKSKTFFTPNISGKNALYAHLFRNPQDYKAWLALGEVTVGHSTDSPFSSYILAASLFQVACRHRNMDVKGRAFDDLIYCYCNLGLKEKVKAIVRRADKMGSLVLHYLDWREFLKLEKNTIVLVEELVQLASLYEAKSSEKEDYYAQLSMRFISHLLQMDLTHVEKLRLLSFMDHLISQRHLEYFDKEEVVLLLDFFSLAELQSLSPRTILLLSKSFYQLRWNGIPSGNQFYQVETLLVHSKKKEADKTTNFELKRLRLQFYFSKLGEKKEGYLKAFEMIKHLYFDFPEQNFSRWVNYFELKLENLVLERFPDPKDFLSILSSSKRRHDALLGRNKGAKKITVESQKRNLEKRVRALSESDGLEAELVIAVRNLI